MNNIKPIDYIVSAKHYGGSGRKYLKKMQEDFRRKGISVNIHGLDKPIGEPVLPEIWQGQWIARCEHCNGASFIDPEEPIFFCFGCGNRSNGCYCRPVVIPDEWREIERMLLERPVNDVAGLTDLERAGMAKPVIVIEKEILGIISGEPSQKVEVSLVRSWKFGESLADLHAQQDEPIQKWRKKLKDTNGI